MDGTGSRLPVVSFGISSAESLQENYFVGILFM
jgi:hypothetical protein